MLQTRKDNMLVGRISELLSSTSEKDDDELHELVIGGELKPGILEGLDEGAFEGMFARMREIKATVLRPGLVFAAQRIVRWAATEGVGELQLGLLRRKLGIPVFSGVLRVLTKAEAQLQDVVQAEDLLTAAAESLGWLAGDEHSDESQQEGEIVKAQCPDAAETLDSSLRVFTTFKKFQTVGVGAMGWLRLHDKAAKAEPWRHAVDVILKAMEELHNGDLQCSALLAFGWLSFSQPSTGLLLVEAGATNMMVSAMQRHPLNCSVQYYGCGTISWLLRDPNTNPQVLLRLRKAGGADATIAAMRLHPNDWGLQVAASMTLATLVARGGAKMLELVVGLGGIEAVVDAMRGDPQHKKVSFAGTCALQVLCQGLAGAELAHNRVSEAGGIQACTAAMQAALTHTPRDFEVADAVIVVLRVLTESNDPTIVTQVLTGGAVAPMLMRLVSFKAPQDSAEIEKLKQFMERLFQLNLGPVGWLCLDTDLIRAELESAVMQHLKDVQGQPDLQHPARTINLVVPVISGIVRRHSSKSGSKSGAVPDEVARFASSLSAYAVLKPPLLRHDLKFLMDHPPLLTIDAKRAWLACERGRLAAMGVKSKILIKTGRTNIVDDLCQTLAPRGAAEVVTLSVGFTGEAAAGDGLRREWFQLVAKEVSDPGINLFCSYDGGRTLQPSPTSDVQNGDTSYFELIGKVAGLALLHGEVLPMRFSAPFLKRILGHVLTPEDLQAVDPEGYKSIHYVLEADSVDDLCLTFSECSDHPADVIMSDDTAGRLAHFELLPGGADKPVTDANKEEYIRLKVEHKLGLLRCRRQVEAFLKGLQEPLPRDTLLRLSRIVSVAELDLLLAGLPDVDIDDWERHAAYAGALNVNSEQSRWLWRMLREDFSSDELAKLLHFATGSASVPATGFAALSGYNGRALPFTLEGRADHGPDHLPTAATCFNRLRIPLYTSYEQMLSRLKTALSGVQQFHEAAMGNPHPHPNPAAPEQPAGLPAGATAGDLENHERPAQRPRRN